MRKDLGIVFFAAFIPRLAFYLFADKTIDPGALYWRLSESLLRYCTLGFDGIPTTSNEPVYPFFLYLARLAMFDNACAVIVLQIAVASVGAIFMYKIADELACSRRVAYISALLYAFYPYLIRQSIAIIDIPVYMPLMMAAVYFYVRGGGWTNWVLCGVMLGLATLARASLTPIWLLCVGALLVTKKIRQALLVASLCPIVHAPFAVWCYTIDGSLMPSRSGLNLLKGNCVYSAQLVPEYSVDLLDGYLARLAQDRFGGTTVDERTLDKYYTAEAVKFMLEDPLRTLAYKAAYLMYLFYPRIVPYYYHDGRTKVITFGDKIMVSGVNYRGLLAELSYAIPYIFMTITALAGLYLRRRSIGRDHVLYIVLFVFVSVCVVYWPATRLRVPMDFALMFFSAVAIDRFLNWRNPCFAARFDAR